MIDWRRVPWTLWLWALLLLAGTVQIEIAAAIHVKLRVFVVLFVLGWIYLLFRGIRNVWIGTLALFVFSVPVELVTDLASNHSPNALGWAISLVQFALLVLPVTRRFFARSVALA